MEISNAMGTLVQFVFYWEYATMSVPAALFEQGYSYKEGIPTRLSFYAIGALFFYSSEDCNSLKYSPCCGF